MRVVLFLNHACNLRCTYCYNGEKFQKRMPWPVAQRGVELALASPPGEDVEIAFFGGEPLLEMDLIRDVMALARRRAQECGRAVGFHVVTNGTLLDDATRETLLREGTRLAVSLDGCAAAHDATRRYANGRSSHAEVAGNVRALAARLPAGAFQVIQVVDPANVVHLAESFDSLLALGVTDVAMNINYAGAWDQPARARFTTALRALGDRYVAAFRAGAAFQLGLLDNKVITHLKGGHALSDRCDFGCHEVAVAPSGRLYPCDRLVGQDDGDDVVIGDIWQGVDATRRDALLASKNAVAPDCADCDLSPRCAHWCGCVNHALTGDVGEVSGVLCWFEQRIIEEADRCAATLYAERNAAFLRRFYPTTGRRHLPVVSM